MCFPSHAAQGFRSHADYDAMLRQAKTVEKVKGDIQLNDDEEYDVEKIVNKRKKKGIIFKGLLQAVKIVHVDQS